MSFAYVFPAEDREIFSTLSIDSLGDAGRSGSYLSLARMIRWEAI